MYHYDKCRHCKNSAEIHTRLLRYWDKNARIMVRYVCSKNDDLRVDLLDKEKIDNCEYYEKENA
jgi:hypothetical protein